MLANPAPSEQAGQTSSKTQRSTLVSRNVTIAGHRTSVRLEPEMWSALSEICRREGGSLHEVCTAVSNRKGENTSLTAAIRVFVMAYYRAAATEDGHTKVGHGYGIAILTSGIPPQNLVGTSARPQTQTPMSGSTMTSSNSSSGYINRIPAINRGGIR